MKSIISNSIEFDGIKTCLPLDKALGLATLFSSIPAKPLVQATLKRGGFFICAL